VEAPAVAEEAEVLIEAGPFKKSAETE
jgi:hypothetical protein